MAQDSSSSILAPFQVLDLTNDKGFFCGRIMGDLGADVIKIEPPGGDPERNIPPFLLDLPGSERSLYWFALNMNKRSMTLDIKSKEGKEKFKILVKTTDFIIESFPPGYLDKLG
jgi:crotonobetainyl-CoA:carnitine CoA-transferase CaiB-like acyl-CoA transferase